MLAMSNQQIGKGTNHDCHGKILYRLHADVILRCLSTAICWAVNHHTHGNHTRVGVDFTDKVSYLYCTNQWMGECRCDVTPAHWYSYVSYGPWQSSNLNIIRRYTASIYDTSIRWIRHNRITNNIHTSKIHGTFTDSWQSSFHIVSLTILRHICQVMCFSFSPFSME